MEFGFIAITSFVLGICAGIGIGRFFCKWHHKNDVKSGFTGFNVPAKLDSRYNPLEEQDDICGPVQGVDQNISTIGDEIKNVKNCGCSPGCCGPADNCCGDKHE